MFADTGRYELGRAAARALRQRVLATVEDPAGFAWGTSAWTVHHLYPRGLFVAGHPLSNRVSDFAFVRLVPDVLKGEVDDLVESWARQQAARDAIDMRRRGWADRFWKCVAPPRLEAFVAAFDDVYAGLVIVPGSSAAAARAVFDVVDARESSRRAVLRGGPSRTAAILGDAPPVADPPPEGGASVLTSLPDASPHAWVATRALLGLAHHLTDDDNIDVREFAARQFAGLGAESLPVVLAMLTHPDDAVREAATTLLGRYTPASNPHELFVSLNDAEVAAAVASLTRALADPNADVAAGAAEALTRYGVASAGEPEG